LSIYLFTPLLASLKARKSKEQSLVNEIENKELEALHKQKSAQKQLFDFQSNVKKNYEVPQVTMKVPSFPIGYKRDEQEIKALSTKVENLSRCPPMN